MRLRPVLALVTVGLLALSACQTEQTARTGTPTATIATAAPDVPSTCLPKGRHLELTVRALRFQKPCLAVKPGIAFTIDFRNDDEGVEHNVSIVGENGERLFTGERITGPAEITYHVDRLPLGTYVFQCDVHPTENGTFLVRG